MPLGLEDKRVRNGQLTAKSQYPGLYAYYGRINMPSGWCVYHMNLNQYLQIKFPAVTKISGLATQGRGNANQYVKKYMVSYSRYGTKFQWYKEGGRVKVGDWNCTDNYDVAEIIKVKSVTFHQ